MITKRSCQHRLLPCGPMIWLSASIGGTILYVLRVDPSVGIITTQDFIHQVSVFEWVYRSVFLRAGPLLSPDFFYPIVGVSLTSEFSLLQGLLFAALRAAGLNVFLAWNLILGLCIYATFIAAYFAFRYEGTAPVVSFWAALTYTSCIIWIFGLVNAISYRSAFGPPLAWVSLSRIRNGDSKGYWWLAVVLLLQFAAGMTITLSVLILAGVRVATDPVLRRHILGCTVACIPVVMCGLAYSQVIRLFSPLGPAADLGPAISSQIFFRLDLTNFLPFIGAISDAYARYAPTERSIEIYLLLWLLLMAMKLRFPDRLPRGHCPPPARGWTSDCILAFLLGLAVTGVLYVQIAARVVLPETVWAGTFLLWTALCCLWLRSVRTEPSAQDTQFGPLHAVTGVLLLVGLGPVLFVSGMPVAVGPLALLDLVAPGFGAIRVPTRLMVTGAFALSMMLAWLWERSWTNRTRTVMAVAAAIFCLSPANLPWEPPDWRIEDIRLDAAACPECSDKDLRKVPLPYQRILEQGKAPLLELPAGTNDGIQHDPVYQFYWVLDGIPRLNGVSSYEPPPYTRFRQEIETFPSPESIKAIRARGARWVLVHGNRYPAGEWERLQEALSIPPPPTHTQQG